MSKDTDRERKWETSQELESSAGHSVDDEENRQKEMFSSNTDLNKDKTMPKAKSVFLIFCKTFGSRKRGSTVRMFSVVVGQSQMGCGFLSFTQTPCNDP